MKKNIILSILGTSEYQPCTYASGRYCSKKTRYIQLATAEMLNEQKKWDPKTDVIYIFGTQKAHDKNWTDSKAEGHIGLEREFRQHGYLPHCQFILIPEGNTKEEIWEIFTIIYNQIEEGSTLYLDITHSLRYMPMLLLVLCNYAKFLKNISIGGITYGNFFTKSSNGGCLITDLTPLISLQEWAEAAAEFTQQGRAIKLQNLAHTQIRNIVKSKIASGETPEPSFFKEKANIEKAIKHCTQWINAMSLCQGRIIHSGKGAQDVCDITKEGNHLIPPMSPIIKAITQEAEKFHTAPTATNLINAAEWCLQHQLLQQSITFLEEGIISLFCEQLRVDVFDRTWRDDISNVMTIIRMGIQLQPKKWKGNKEHIQTILNSKVINHNIAQLFCDLAQKRNIVNHAEMNNAAGLWKEPTVAIESIIRQTKEQLLSGQKPTPTESTPPKDPKLLNFSNHPLSTWSEKQKTMASKEYGPIIDWTFPQISPDTTEDEIEDLVKQHLTPILQLHKQYKLTVHIMGEMTFTFSMVNRLKSYGIPCIASCSIRETKEDNGIRISHFHFEKFRRY